MTKNSLHKLIKITSKAFNKNPAFLCTFFFSRYFRVISRKAFLRKVPSKMFDKVLGAAQLLHHA